MRNNHSSLRRGHHGVSNGASVSTSPTNEIREKRPPQSILPLACQRWWVRFLSARKTSQLLVTITIITILFLLPSTVYFLSGLPTQTVKTIKKRRQSRGRNQVQKNHIRAENTFQDNHDTPEQQVFHRIDVFPEEFSADSEDSDYRESFGDRETFAAMQPRIVMLHDHDNLWQVTNTKSNLTTLPEEGYLELKRRYVPLSTTLKEPKQHSAITERDKGCEALASWQDTSRPTCNVVHEATGGWQKVNTNLEAEDDSGEQTRFVAEGGYRQVWMIRDYDGITKFALKELRGMNSKNGKEQKYTLRNEDRHRRDAMAFEVLSHSPLVGDMYAACSNSAVFEFASEGDLNKLWEKKGFEDEADIKSKTTQEVEEFKMYLFELAYNVSMSVHHAHNIDEHGRATMAHTDIKPDQWVFVDGYYKLIDFNRVRFLSWNSKKGETCGFTVGKNAGGWRAPEEYAYEPETEKVDVYSLGNVLYKLLTGDNVWENIKKSEEKYSRVMAGERPKFPPETKESKGIFEQTMIKAIEKCWTHRPEKRPGALEIAKIIEQGLKLEKSLKQA